MLNVDKQQLEQLIDLAWAMHDEAEARGDKRNADFYAQEAFNLLEQIPQNAVYLLTKQ